MDKYIIFVNLPNVILTFRVNDYEIIEGGLLKFWDNKQHCFKRYDSRICEIKEVNKYE